MIQTQIQLLLYILTVKFIVEERGNTMVIDLEKSVSISEYASITVSGIKKEEIEEI